MHLWFVILALHSRFFLSARLCGLVVRRRFPSTDKPEIAGSSPASVTFLPVLSFPTVC